MELDHSVLVDSILGNIEGVGPGLGVLLHDPPTVTPASTDALAKMTPASAPTETEKLAFTSAVSETEPVMFAGPCWGHTQSLATPVDWVVFETLVTRQYVVRPSGACPHDVAAWAATGAMARDPSARVTLRTTLVIPFIMLLVAEMSPRDGWTDCEFR